MPRLYAALIALLLAVPSVASAQAAEDRAAVRQAALDYVEALYEADTVRVVRSVHPALTKYGYYRADGTYRGGAMTYDELKQLAARWNRDHRRVDPATAVKEIIVFDVLDKTASAKVVAHWGVDYMHLAKVDGRWMIRNILWQSPPPGE
jgi:hypothetical protein